MKNTFTSPPFFLGFTSLFFFSACLLWWCRGMGNEGCGQFKCWLSAPSSSQGRLLKLFRCSTIGPFMECSPSGSDSPACAPTRSQVLQVLLWCGLLSSQGHGSWQEPAAAQASHRVTASFGHPPAWCAIHWGLQVDSCCIEDLHGLLGHSLPHHVLHHGLQENLGSSAWSSSCLTSASALVPAELFLLHILLPHTLLLLTAIAHLVCFAS